MEEKKISENLPPSSDKEFWEDAEIHTINLDKVPKKQMGKHNKLIMRGPYLVCLSCPFEHTIPGYMLNKRGKLVRIK